MEVTRELPGDGCSSTAEVTAWTTVAAVEVAPDDAGALDQIELAAADTEVSCDEQGAEIHPLSGLLPMFGLGS